MCHFKNVRSPKKWKCPHVVSKISTTVIAPSHPPLRVTSRLAAVMAAVCDWTLASVREHTPADKD